ncbi:tryptophan 7-halogenase [Candidatus Protofrankia californiensis]|uniref:tryptophan 7-halogenase n=1 Tax=Candidatus Protofrankia californiensis TaxID=1839754 RepID=UPI00104111B6|nr:tryptophan 7-halogenase [Candidatus Protofrankia californiensis]
MASSRRLQVVVCGAGVAGTTVSLALARLGHAVTLIERDTAVRPARLDEAGTWKRIGVAQLHQPHAFLARICSELLTGLPDIVDALWVAGAVDLSLPEGVRLLQCRRSTLEWVLRRGVETEPGIDLRTGTVQRVETRQGAVVGVRLAGGGLCPADLVIDCGGRRSRLTAGMRAEEAFDEPANEVYVSRRYRALPGRQLGPVNRGAVGVEEADGYALLVFPHDAGTFTVAFVHMPRDRGLAALRRTPVFESAARIMSLGADWTDPDFAEPISNIMVMKGLRNAFRPLGPAAPDGLHALGDTVCTTNPHFGRGASLAVAHAFRLVQAVAEDPSDPAAWRDRVDAWVRDELWSWFDDARLLDRARSAAWGAVMEGGLPSIPSMSPPSPVSVPRFVVLAAAGADPVVAAAALRHMQMVDPPDALDAVEPRVANLIARGWRPSRPPGVPTRAELVDMISAVSVPAR